MIALAQTGKVGAHVQTFSLDDAPRVYDLMREGALRGRAVVVPS